MLKIGITGNIGSGKSTVCKIFENLQIPVFYADIEARKLYFEEKIKNEVRMLFGTRVFSGDEIDTKKLAAVIFSDPAALDKINNLIHPNVLKKYEQWLEQFRDVPYTLHEAAVLFEHNLQHRFHKTICVTAPNEIRVQRVMKRDGASEAEVRKRMARQWPEEKKVAAADFTVVNDGSRFLIPQVLKIHRQLIHENSEKLRGRI